jgi:hypothetical protein
MCRIKQRWRRLVLASALCEFGSLAGRRFSRVDSTIALSRKEPIGLAKLLLRLSPGSGEVSYENPAYPADARCYSAELYRTDARPI